MMIHTHTISAVFSSFPQLYFKYTRRFMPKIISSVSLIHCALHTNWQQLPFSFTLGMIVLKLILCGVDLSFHIIDYLLSASFPLYGIQLCYFSLIYFPSLPASLVITFCCLVLSFFSGLLLLVPWSMNVTSVLNPFCLSFSIFLHVICIFFWIIPFYVLNHLLYFVVQSGFIQMRSILSIYNYRH